MLIERFLDVAGIERGHLLWLAETASKRYKIYNIAKRSGGNREISHPARSIKAIQRWLNRAIFAKFPVHERATAYKKGACIKKNASLHLGTNFTLRLDYKDFFPSFDCEMIKSFLERYARFSGVSLDADDIDFVCKIVTKDSRLTIGAPSSPIITNAIMYEFDVAANDICRSANLVYTRYADDIFISSVAPNMLEGVKNKIYTLNRDIFGEKLVFNTSKTCFLSRKYKRSVTGIVLTSSGRISIGRAKKREIRTLVYKYMIGELDPVGIWRARGLVAFCMDVEPDFVSSLFRKYGKEAVDALMSDGRVKSNKIVGALRRPRFPRRARKM